MAMLLWIPSVTKAQVFEVGGITYNVLSQAEQTAEVAPSCSRYRGNINIPSVVTHDGITYDVVALGEMAFYGCTLSSVSIPSSVTKIKYGCFLFANGPATITLPSSVKDIDVIALAANNLTAIAVDENNPYFMELAEISRKWEADKKKKQADKEMDGMRYGKKDKPLTA